MYGQDTEEERDKLKIIETYGEAGNKILDDIGDGMSK